MLLVPSPMGDAWIAHQSRPFLPVPGPIGANREVDASLGYMALKAEALKVPEVIPCAAFMERSNVVYFHPPTSSAMPTTVVVTLKGCPPYPPPLAAIEVKPASHICHTKG